ncbi:MAG: DUF4838 domain-containing protein [Planctomycetes bacterium]|nr:DUF4838 domain-containing protein [Planctomycetota bacterium]
MPCLSAEGLIEQNVKFARAVFDIYDEPMVSVMPQDGYASVCQCDLCRGKETPERGWFGTMSDYVWAYTDRVAREVHKTHPKRWISGGAYGTYLLPPEKIDRLSPNVVVGIVHHRAHLGDPDEFKKYVDIVNGWKAKATSGKIMRWVHYLESMPTSAYHGLPVYYPHAIAKDLRFLKGSSLGDFIEMSFDRDAANGALHAPAFNHLHVYLTARLYWDVEQDVDRLLAEYYQTFYGPAARHMKALIDYSEANWLRMAKEVEPIDKAQELLKAAQDAAGDTIYGKRIALLAQYLSPMKGLRERLTKGREGVPEARGLAGEEKDIVLDGKLDDKLWERQPKYTLREIQTGRKPLHGTTFQLGWAGDSLYFGIRCEEPDMANLKIGATKDDDTNIWHGDCIELLIETQCHSYYQIAVSPSGAVMDLDRKGGRNTQWSSGVTAAVHRGADFWSVEVRVPLTGDMRGSPDPLHGVAGGRPTITHPFHFNVCRQRIRDAATEATAFSPTGKNHFHDVMKFGKLYVK